MLQSTPQHSTLASQHPRALIWFYVVMLLFGFVYAELHAEEQNVNPGINRYYYDTEYENWVSVFENPGREVYAKRHAIVEALQLQPGLRVADIGAGTGFYTRLFAEQVGTSGKVYAIDISRDFIRAILDQAQQQGLANIEGIVNDARSIELPASSIDLAFICDTYHHFEYPRTILASIHQAIRPGGRLVIIDFRKQSGLSSAWVMSHVRANEAEVIKEIESAGFKLTDRSDLLKTNYFLTFSKPAN